MMLKLIIPLSSTIRRVTIRLLNATIAHCLVMASSVSAGKSQFLNQCNFQRRETVNATSNVPATTRNQDSQQKCSTRSASQGMELCENIFKINLMFHVTEGHSNTAKRAGPKQITECFVLEQYGQMDRSQSHSLMSCAKKESTKQYLKKDSANF